MSYVPAPKGRGTCSHQVAFAVSRKFGTAVERNRVRRRLKAAFVDSQRQIAADSALSPPPGLYLLIPGRVLLDLPYPEVVATLQACYGRLTPPN